MKWDLGTAIYALRRNIKLSSLKYVGVPNTTVMLSEAYAFHEPSLKSRPQDFEEIVRARFRRGMSHESTKSINHMFHSRLTASQL